MSAIRLTDPAVEPVSTAELRDWLRIDPDVEDATLASLATSARLALEGWTRRGFISQTWRFTTLSCGTDQRLRPPLAPLRGLVALRWYDASDVATTLAPTSVALETDDQRPAAHILDAVVCAKAVRYELDVVIGYGDAAASVPAPLRQAILMLASFWHARRGDDPDAAPGLPRAVAALAQPYRRARLS